MEPIINIAGGGGEGEEDLYDHLMPMRLFILTMNKIFTCAPNTTRRMATDKIWNWQSFSHKWHGLQSKRSGCRF